MLVLVLVAIVCALAVGQPPGVVDLPTVRLAFVGLAMAAVVAQAVVACRLVKDERDGRFWDGINLGLWTLMSLFCVQIMRWPSLVRGHLDDLFPLADELLILSLLLVPLGMTWTLLDLEPLGRSSAGRWARAIRHGWMRIRFVSVLAVLPLLWIAGVDDLFKRFGPELADRYRTLTYLASIALLVFSFPWVMRRVWQVTPLASGPLRDRLRHIATTARVPLKEILYWDTGQRVANAFVAGLWGRWRYVFLTDGLLEALDDDQVEMVFAHEMGHVVQRHLLLRVLALLLPLSLLLITAPGFSAPAGAVPAGPVAAEAVAAFPTPLAIESIVVLLTLAYVWLGLGWYSRQLEHQADLWSCRYLADNQHRDLESCVQRYVQGVAMLTPESMRHRQGWLHPSLVRRERFLLEVAHRPRRRSQFERLMKTMAVALGLLSGLGLGLVVLSAWPG